VLEDRVAEDDVGKHLAVLDEVELVQGEEVVEDVQSLAWAGRQGHVLHGLVDWYLAIHAFELEGKTAIYNLKKNNYFRLYRKEGTISIHRGYLIASTVPRPA